MPQTKRYLKGYRVIPANAESNVTVPKYQKWNKKTNELEKPAPQVLIFDPEISLHVKPDLEGVQIIDEKEVDVYLKSIYGERVVPDAPEEE